MTKHAVFANALSSNGDMLTFRIGKPADWDTAIRRWTRLDNRRAGHEGVRRRPLTVRFDRRQYTVTSFEVREVNVHGVGRGEDRHRRALPVTYFDCVSK